MENPAQPTNGEVKDNEGKASLVIVMDKEGKVLVNGPLYNKLLCYGMLGAAFEAILAWTPGQTKLVKPTIRESMANLLHRRH